MSASAPKTSPEVDESEFLARQAADAKAAISRVLTDFKTHLARSADVRVWTKDHPWMMVGSAAAAGFFAAISLVPSKEEQALKELAKINRAIAPRIATLENADGQENAQAVADKRRSFLSGLGKEVLSAVKPILMSAITAGVAAKAVKPDQSEQYSPAEQSPMYQDQAD